MPFPCTQCGECCRRTARLTDEELQAFGLRRGPSGACDQFIEGLCRNYEHRPLVCRIPADRYVENAAICNAWMAEAGETNFITLEQLRAAR